MDQSMHIEGKRKLPSLEDSLRLGQAFHLEFEGLPALNGGYDLWGICPNQSIMVSAPQLELSNQLLNTPVKARLFIEQLDSACAFRTTVSTLCATPSIYVHLSMPDNMVTGEVRRTDRIAINLPCELRYDKAVEVNCDQANRALETRVSKAEIHDASVQGCRIQTDASDLRVGDCIKIFCDITIFDVNQTLELDAMIMSRKGIGGSYSLGAQFLELKDCNRITLSSYLQKYR